MHDLTDNVSSSARRSCTVDDVVVHLMRWKREDAQRKYILGKGEGLSRDELAHVHVALKRPTLTEQLFGLHDRKHRLKDKLRNLAVKHPERLHTEISECDSLIEKIDDYLRMV